MYKTLSVIVLAFTIAAAPLFAQEEHEMKAKRDSSESEIPKPVLVSTQHSITIDGKLIRYTATTGTMLLRNHEDKPIALFGYTAYTKDGVTDPSTRPVTFAYNGGPGSSSIWLHMGALGPKKIVLNDPHATPPAPYQLEDNTNSILDVTDLVIIDAIGTGFSRPVGKAKGSEFWASMRTRRRSADSYFNISANTTDGIRRSFSSEKATGRRVTPRFQIISTSRTAFS
jgi:carboxypeptidase C (cathepsin A)